MPNGRSGGFIIDKADLKQMLRAMQVSIATTKADELSSPHDSTDVLELARLVEACPSDRIAVEEQDHLSYIIHLSDEPEAIWFAVGPNTPIFVELRERHKRWAHEHPGWNGWIAF
jgi:hypothetical protein